MSVEDKPDKATGDKQYIVKRVFVGEKDIETVLTNLAERRALGEMGLD